MLPQTVGSILSEVAALQNDTAQQLYTDAAILIYFKIAYDDLKLLTEAFGLPISFKTSDSIIIPAGIKNINGSGGPTLPNDLIEILAMYERTDGTSNDFLIMSRRQFLPKIEVQTAYLQYWAWENQVVKLIGATSDIEVKIDYIADGLGDVIDSNTALKYYNCRGYLRYRTAALCSQYIGENEDRFEKLQAEAQNSFDSLAGIAIKTQQSTVTRRRPFRAGFKSSNGWW